MKERNYKFPPVINKERWYKIFVEMWLPLPINIFPEVVPNQYFVSNYGKLFNSRTNTVVPKELFKDKNMYIRVALEKVGGGYIHYDIHRLMMMTYRYFPGCENYDVNHEDGVKWHNELYNLTWVTRQENVIHAINNNLKPIQTGEEAPQSILSNKQYNEICRLLSEGLAPKEIADKLQYLETDNLLTIIYNIKSGKTGVQFFNNYDMSNMYHRPERMFSDEQVNIICKLLEQYGKTNISTRDILINIGINPDLLTPQDIIKYRDSIRKIKQRKNYKDISINYKF